MDIDIKIGGSSILLFLPGLALWVILKHFIDLSERPTFAQLLFYSCLALSPVLWGLICFFLYITLRAVDHIDISIAAIRQGIRDDLRVTRRIIGYAFTNTREQIRLIITAVVQLIIFIFITLLKPMKIVYAALLSIPSHLLQLYIDFWQQWAITPRRFGWQSLRTVPDSRTPLLSETECNRGCRTTSELCKECFQIIEQSTLLSGSFSLLTPRFEWHKWAIPLQGLDFCASRRTCHLCNILWHSLNEQRRTRLTSLSSGRVHRNTISLSLWLGIWKYQDGCYYLQLLENASLSENPPKLPTAIEIREEQLTGHSPSVHVPTWTSSKECVELAKGWIIDCQSTHKSHCSASIFKNCERYLPTRLLYVGDNASRLLRIEETSPDFALTDVKYLTLSYRRSENGLQSSQKLTLENKEDWKREINEKDLPLTFQHAIYLARRLGVSYLWIDALCIIQDSPRDSKTEAINMGKVFANAHCTISSSDSTGVNDGFFHERTSSLLEFPCYLRFSKTRGLKLVLKGHTHDSNSFSEQVGHKPSSGQAWSLQERLLSRRILHFGSRYLFFECNTHISSEVMPSGQPFRGKRRIWEKVLRQRENPQLHPAALQTSFNPVNGYRSFMNELRHNRSASLNGGEELHLHKLWFELVSRFTKTTIYNPTQPSDRITAILGLAQAIKDGSDDIEYMHGLWLRHLIFDLLWFVESRPTKKPTGPRTRSWSWQAVEGEIDQKLMLHEKAMVGRERSLIKVAVVITEDIGYSTGSSSEPLVKDHLLLKCPIFRGTNVFRSGPQSLILQLQTPEGGVEASFIPDFTDFDESNLIGAEIIREVTFKTSKMGQREISAIWSNGIVLQRNFVSSLQGVQVTYERVGRFWMEWPLVRDENDPQSRNIARTILNRTRSYVIRIE